MKEFINKIEGVEDGTDINRANLMAAQGFANFTFIRTAGGIEISYNYGDIEDLSVEIANGQIIESYSGDKTVTMITSVISDGYRAVIE